MKRSLIHCLWHGAKTVAKPCASSGLSNGEFGAEFLAQFVAGETLSVGGLSQGARDPSFPTSKYSARLLLQLEPEIDWVLDTLV